MNSRLSLLKWFCCLFATLLSGAAFGQGTVHITLTSPITVIVNGVEQPVPSANVYNLGVYYPPGGTTDEALFVQLGGPVGIPAGGLVLFSANRTIPITPAGATAALQLRGWEIAYGSSYDAVKAGGQGATGKSIILNVDTGNPGAPIPETPGDARFPGFLLAVPEPGTIAFFAAGGALLVFSLRRKAAR